MTDSKELLVNTIKEWVAINNKMNEIQKLLKDLRGKKKQLSDSLIKIMENNEIDGIDTNNGKLNFWRDCTPELQIRVRKILKKILLNLEAK